MATHPPRSGRRETRIVSQLRSILTKFLVFPFYRPTESCSPPSVLDPLGASIASATAADIGQNALIQSLATTGATSGTYTFVVTGATSTVGRYSVRLTLNGAREDEGVIAAASNDNFDTAQNIDGGMVSLGGWAALGAVLGRTEAGHDDWYAVSLNSEDTLTLAPAGRST